MALGQIFQQPKAEFPSFDPNNPFAGYKLGDNLSGDQISWLKQMRQGNLYNPGIGEGGNATPIETSLYNYQSPEGPIAFGVSGGLPGQSGFGLNVHRNLGAAEKLDGQPIYQYDETGKMVRSGIAQNMKQGGINGIMGSNFGPLIPLAIAGGAAALGLGGAGAAGAAEGAGGAAAADFTMGGAAGAFTPATAAEMAGMGVGGAGGAAAGLGGSGGGLLEALKTLGGKAVSSVFNGGGNGASGGGGFGGMGASDLVNILAALYGSNQQGKASDSMLNWLNEQTNYVKNYGNVGSPERAYLEDQLARKDAASGRNSQYGPRAVDLEARLAETKMNNVSRLAMGLAPSFSSAINQDANKYAGIPAALNKAFGGSVGSTLGNIINGFTKSNGGSSGGSTISNDQFWDMVGQEGMPIDYAGGLGNPTEDDVLPFLEGLNLAEWYD
jgi:hypothetical protein